MSVSQVPVGLQGYLQTLDVTTTPQPVYGGFSVPGRYMMVFIQYGTVFLGGVDFILDGVSLSLIASYNFINVTKGAVPFSLGLKDSSDIIYLDYQNGNLLVSSENDTIPYVSFKTFIIATQYAGMNIYAVDNVMENTIGHGITIDNNVEMSTIATGSVSFVNTTDTSTWSNTSAVARRFGKIVYLSGNATLTVGVNGVLTNSLLDLVTITPTNNFIDTLPTVGNVVIKNGSEYISSSIINNVSDSSIAKLQLLIPLSLSSGDTRDISFSLSYIVA